MRRFAILLCLLGASPGWGADVEWDWVTSAAGGNHRATVDTYAVVYYYYISGIEDSDNPNEVEWTYADPDDLPAGGKTVTQSANAASTSSDAHADVTMKSHTNAQADSYVPFVVSGREFSITVEGDASPAHESHGHMQSNTSARSFDEYDLPTTNVGDVTVKGITNVDHNGGSGDESLVDSAWISIISPKATSIAKEDGGATLSSVKIFWVDSGTLGEWYITRSGKSGTPSYNYKDWGTAFDLSADNGTEDVYDWSYPRFEIECANIDSPTVIVRGDLVPSEKSVGFSCYMTASLQATN